jgi:hypothetical protein
MRTARLSVFLLLFVMAGCTSGATSTHAGSPHGGPAAGPSPGSSPPTLADAMRACPVTRPNGSRPPGAGGGRFVGGDGLWTVLWPHGLVLVPKENVGPGGALEMKFPWWRGSGVRGTLDITGEDVGTHRPVSARTAGYGLTGFNASAIVFPGEGCFRVTGRAGTGELTFVTLVRTCSVLPELPRGERRRLAQWCR